MTKIDYKARAKKAWATRRSNAEKKRGVKSGTKRGPYRKASKRIPFKYKKLEAQTGIPIDQWIAMNKAAQDVPVKPGLIKLETIKPSSLGNFPKLDLNARYLISNLTSAIDDLEAKLTAQIDRIKSILN